MLSLVTQNAKKFSGNPEFQKDALKAISQTVEKMEGLIYRLTNLSKGITLRMEKKDLNLAIEEITQKFNGTLNTPLELDLKPIPEIFFDSFQIERVLSNLFLNADEASSGNGKIIVHTFSLTKGVKIEVEDEGKGFPKEILEEGAFKPFKTSKSKGLGIGLFQCKQIIEAHRGQIEVLNKKEKGCKISIFLPNS